MSDNTTSLHNIETENKISVYPNPNQGQITISATNGDCIMSSLIVFNLTGFKVMEINNLNKRIIDTELNLKTGIYFIKIISNKGFQIEKIIVE